jgi:hypothetical protein
VSHIYTFAHHSNVLCHTEPLAKMILTANIRKKAKRIENVLHIQLYDKVIEGRTWEDPWEDP